MTDKPKQLPSKSTRSEVDAFLRKVAATSAPRSQGQRGRLLFAMDATASRGATWDQACHIQSEMFTETSAHGGLDIQLCYYRGFREFSSSPWLSSAKELLAIMSQVQCAGGITQIVRTLRHAITESKRAKIDAVVFIGDCMEEDVDRLAHTAGELGLRGVPVFVFQEGYEPIAERSFRDIARLTRGAYCRFDAGSVQQLRELLGAVAVYAAGGRRALQDFSRGKKGLVPLLTSQIK